MGCRVELVFDVAVDKAEMVRPGLAQCKADTTRSASSRSLARARFRERLDDLALVVQHRLA